MTRYHNVNDGTGNVEVPFTQAEEDAQDIIAAQWVTDHPEDYILADAKLNRIKRATASVRDLYRKHIDPHYLQKNREEAEGGSYTVPASIKTYVSNLKSTFVTIKAEINALSTIEDVKSYAIGQDGNTGWPKP